jgi:hypothetical protein
MKIMGLDDEVARAAEWVKNSLDPYNGMTYL